MIGSELFPFVSWLHTIGLDLTVSVTRAVSGTVTTDHTIGPSTVLGATEQITWTDGGTYSEDWIHLLVARALAAHADIDSVSSAYATTGYAYPRCTHTVTFTAGNPVLSWYIEGGADAMRSLGFHGTPSGGLIRIAGVGSTVSTTGYHAGLLAPCVPWSVIDDAPGYIAQQAVSPFEPDQRTVVSLGARNLRAVQWRHVPQRMLSTWYAEDAASAAQALSSTSDTYGTVQRLVDAVVVSDRALRLVESSGDGVDCVLDWASDLTVRSLAEVEDGIGGRRYTITLPTVLT